MDFEKAFSDFIDRREYDQASNALFAMIRISFTAGWLAANGQPPKDQKVIELLRINPRTTDPAAIETEISLDEK